MDFEATLDIDNKTSTGVTVPTEIVEVLNVGEHPSVPRSTNGKALAALPAGQGRP